MSIPVLSVAQMREWEKTAWASGKTPAQVIGQVGSRIAVEATRLTHPGERIVALAGTGNNGADARAAAAHIQGREIQIFNLTDPATQFPQVEAALNARPALVIDALFGIGLNRPLSQEWTQLIELVNRSGIDVLAIDVPSGLNADTGVPEGVAIKATWTLTVGAPKVGMLAPEAHVFTGRILVAEDVGLGPPPERTDLEWVTPGEFVGFPPARPLGSHKGTHGHLAIFAGSEGYHGAATLCARGAQRGRPGLITLFTMEPVYQAIASQCQAVMVSRWIPDGTKVDSWTAIVVGPGLADSQIPEEFRHMVRRLWKDSNLPVIVDASALAWLKASPVNPGFLRVITPHPGEAARMLGITNQAVQADRPRVVRELSQKFGGTWVVLKGHQTLIGQSRGPILVNSSGGPSLGQGGSGDLLSGFIGGLLAQPAFRTSPSRVLSYAIWQHGASADHLDEVRPNWVVEDLAEAIGQAKPHNSR